MNYKHGEVTNKILAAYQRVYNRLGYGFPEKVYGSALAVEFEIDGVRFVREAPIPVFYKGRAVGEFYVDFLVEDKVIVEIKALKELIDANFAQLLTYLKSSKIEVGLLLNFGPQPITKRRVFDNENKGNLSWTSSADSESIEA